MHSVTQNFMKTAIFKLVFCLASSLPSSIENEHLIILKKQNHTWNARAKIKVVDFIMSSICLVYRRIEWIGSTKPLNKFLVNYKQGGNGGGWGWGNAWGEQIFLRRYYISAKIKVKNLQLVFKVTFENICSLNI